MSPVSQAGWLAAVVMAGAVLTLQSGLNAGLGKHLGHPLLAVLASFAIGALASALLLIAFRIPIPSLAHIGAAPKWLWIGGAMGVIYISISTYGASRLGAVALVGGLLAGQLSASLLLDHFGVAGFSERPITLVRVLGVLLIGAGVLLVQFGPGAADPGGQ